MKPNLADEIRAELAGRLGIGVSEIVLVRSREGAIAAEISVLGRTWGGSLSAPQVAGSVARRRAAIAAMAEDAREVLQLEPSHAPPAQNLVAAEDAATAAVLRDVTSLLRDCEIPARPGCREVAEYKATIMEAVDSLVQAISYRRKLADPTTEIG